MLGSIEPQFELRFVEKVDTRIVSTTIDKFPAVIGHRGSVQPVILNGQISSYHCEINWNWVKQEYQVQDGMDGKPSTNHIYFSDGGESVLCDRAVLKTLKDRVYLIRTIDGKEGYLELFDPMQERGGDTRSTLDIDPRMVEFRATAIDAKEKALEGLGVANETKVIVQKNSEAIGELDANIVLVNKTLAVLKTAGADARLVILGTIAVGFAGLTGITLLFLHANIDSIYKDVRDRNQHTEQRKDLNRPMLPGG
mgnify:CR=1 FL=1